MRRLVENGELAVVLGLVCCIGGCQSVLGIDDLSEAPRPGSAGQGGAGGTGMSGGSAGASGGNTGGDQSGASGTGGATGGTAGSAGSSGMAGAPPENGSPDAGAGGPITVSGHVVDFLLHPVPGLRVTIGEQEVLSGDDGAFTIEGVTPPYDVSLIAATTQSSFSFRYYAYVYQGLTRPDPTVQVYYGLPERGNSLELAVSNNVFGDGDNRQLLFAFSSPDGAYTATGINVVDPTLFPGWNGPASTAGNAHGLLVQRSSTDTGAPPLGYEAYQTTPLALTDEVDSILGLDMTADTIPTITLTGSVDSGPFGSHTHLIATRFGDGTVLPLLTADSSQEAFSYLLPVLPDASLTVAASAGIPGYAVAHADGVPATAQQNVALVLPRPVSPNTPGNGTAVGPGTAFSWSTVGQSAQVFVWHIESDAFFEGIYVITSRSEIAFPQVPGYSMNLPPAGEDWGFYWTVETHGDYPSVDAAAGPAGLFDSFALELNVGTGPSRGGAGYFTNSDVRSVAVTAQ